MTPRQAATRLPGALSAGDWPVAHKALIVLSKADPANASLAYNLGLVLRRLGRDREAEKALSRALALACDHHNARFELAACHMDLGEMDRAEAGFDAYCAVRAQDADAWLNLARLRLRRGDGPGAIDAFSRRAALVEWDLEAEIGKAEALLLVDAQGGQAALAALFRAHAGERPRLLKAMTQGRRGRMPLSASSLLG
ncbi:tetratricopeptide repeat protein [Stappia sp.]|uniref:tetratricopeptide repeat protein n=1 Tax=Stappia sp. TaxID=1870903 RepID=UPI003A9A65C8